jgi:hypothetical protein
MQYVQDYHPSVNCGVHKNEGSRTVVQVRWSFLQQGHCCLNSDGAIRCGDQQAGCDRVIRDRRGNSVCGFAKAGVGNK